MFSQYGTSTREGEVMVHMHEGVEIRCEDDIPVEELETYAERCLRKKPGTYLLEVRMDGEYVELSYKYRASAVPFERIRRVTGYLSGTLDRFNNAKRAEEADRVKHAV